MKCAAFFFFHEIDFVYTGPNTGLFAATSRPAAWVRDVEVSCAYLASRQSARLQVSC